MTIHAQIVKLPAPVLAIIHHEDGRISHNFAATLYLARQEAHRAGATEISDTLGNDLAFHQSESTTYAVAKRSGNRIQSSKEAQNMPVLRRTCELRHHLFRLGARFERRPISLCQPTAWRRAHRLAPLCTAPQVRLRSYGSTA